jgi:GNAT superfamily N-acetyltransferase
MDDTLEVAVAGRTLVVREVAPADEPGLSRLFADSADWFEAATGLPSSDGDVQSLYYALPEGADPTSKRLLVIAEEEKILGLVDLVLRHPGERDCSVGMFLIGPAHRRRGIGGAVARELLGRARSEGIGRVTATNAEGWRPGEQFLAALGFRLGGGAEARTRTGNRDAGPYERPVVTAELDLAAPVTD